MEEIILPRFNKAPGAIALDLDGTLLNSQTQLSNRNRRALEECIARNIPVIIATSRPTRIFNRIFPEDLAEGCSLAVMNGAIVKGKPPLSGYFKETLPEETTRSIIDTGLEFNSKIRITLELDGYEFGANWTADPDTLWVRNSASPDMLLSLEEAMPKQPCKIALGGLGTDILKLVDRLKYTFGDAISVIPALWGNPLLNITSLQASKPSALRKLLDPEGISLDDVVCFGDDVPDVEMLRECGISISVANAVPEAKAASKYHTASNDDDGVAIILEKMLVGLHE